MSELNAVITESAPIEIDGEPREPISDHPVAEQTDDKKVVRRLRLSVSLHSLVIALVIAGLLGGIGTLGWLYTAAQRRVDSMERQQQNNARAEKISLDYAVRAAEMNFKDINAWKVKLVAGTGPELKEKLTKAAGEMEQILIPLEWTSTAQPIVAKVRSDSDGVYTVDTFVSVMTKTVQGPQPLQSTATYSITIDSNRDWQISDVGGIGTVGRK